VRKAGEGIDYGYIDGWMRYNVRDKLKCWVTVI
jgi:hypothetical protein